jgi:hypothetical protein
MSSAQMHQGSLNVIFDAQARLQKTQEALATGKKINEASDDPVASAQITAGQSGAESARGDAEECEYRLRRACYDRGQFVVSRRFNFEGPGNFSSGIQLCAWS